MAGAAVVLRRAVAAKESHDCRSPWPESERIEGRLLEAALAVVAAGKRVTGVVT